MTNGGEITKTLVF